MYRRRSHRDALKAAGAGRQWLACPARVTVSFTASMSADAVRFPKGVFPPDADFGKGEPVPIKHPTGVGGSPRGRTVGSSPLVHSFGTFLLHNRKVHFLTSRGRCGECSLGLKNLFVKTVFRRASRCVHRVKALLHQKKQSPPGIPGENRKINLVNHPHRCICNSPHPPRTANHIIPRRASSASESPPTWSIMPYFTASSPSMMEPTSVAISSGRIMSS